MAMNAALVAADPQCEEILDIFAREARIERRRLHLEARAEDLGASSLDMAMALFELEDRYDIQLPELQSGAMAWTVGQWVQQVLTAIDNARVAGAAEPVPAR
jgi:acyl carrier protein